MYVQICNPKYRIKENFNHIEDIGDFFFEVFEFPTESLFIMWDGLYLYLNYKYDIFLCVGVFIDIINDLLDNKQGKFSHHFYSDSFCCTWEFIVDRDIVNIDMTWNFPSDRKIESIDFDKMTIDKDELINELSEIPRFLNAVVEENLIPDKIKKEWNFRYKDEIRRRNRGILYS